MITTSSRIRAADYYLFAEAWCAIAFARFLLVFVPFRRLVRLLKAQSQQQENGTPEKLLQISAAIQRGARRSPWRAKCFEQALAAKMMLMRRHFQVTIHFGVTKTEGELKAHAWADSYGTRITGGKNTDAFTLLASF